MNTVSICYKFIVIEDVNQEEKLLMMLEWQWFDVVIDVGQVLDGLTNNLLLRQHLLKKWLFFTVMMLFSFKHQFKMEIQLQIYFSLDLLTFESLCWGLKLRWQSLKLFFHFQFFAEIWFIGSQGILLLEIIKMNLIKLSYSLKHRLILIKFIKKEILKEI